MAFESIFQEPDIVAPEPEANLWRYMDFTKFVAMLQDSELHFARADCLGDDYECAYPPANVKRLQKPETWEIYSKNFPDADYFNKFKSEMIESGKRAGMDNSLLAARTFYANCWHENSQESAAMWKLYLKSSEGIAIRTTGKAFIDTLSKSDLIIQFSKVKYIDYDNTHFNGHNLFNYVIHKRLSFSHETEVRAIIWGMCAPNRAKLFPDPRIAIPFEDEWPRGIKVKIDLRELIKEVYIAPTTPGWFKQVVIKTLDKYEIGVNVQPSKLDDRPMR